MITIGIISFLRMTIEVLGVYFITRRYSIIAVAVLSVMIVLIEIAYEQVTIHHFVCRDLERHSNTIMRNFLGRSMDKYENVGEFIHVVDEYPQKTMFIRKSVLDASVDLIIFIGFIVSLPDVLFKYIGILILILVSIVSSIFYLRKFESRTFPLMNQSLSHFDKIILNVTSSIESVIGSKTVDRSKMLLERLGISSERNKNNYSIAIDLQTSVLMKSSIIPVLLVIHVAVQFSLDSAILSTLIVYSLLISNRILYIFSSVIDAVVSGRFYNDIKTELKPLNRQHPRFIRSVQNMHLPIGNGNSLFCGNIDIKAGKVHIIKGKSGAGKSTLIEGLLGFREFESIKDFHSDLSYFDEDTSVGYVSQKVAIFDMSEDENIHLGRKNVKGGNILFRKRKDEWDWQGLSGGERIETGVKRALSMQPDILILDEIDRNLDQVTLDNLMRQCMDSVYTLLIVSHLENIHLDNARTILVKDNKVVMK